jgi:hypothetical protein
VELAGPAIGHVGVKTGLAGWVGGLGFSPKPYREWKIFYVFFSNSLYNFKSICIKFKIKCQTISIRNIYNAKAHISTNENMQ